MRIRGKGRYGCRMRPSSEFSEGVENRPTTDADSRDVIEYSHQPEEERCTNNGPTKIGTMPNYNLGRTKQDG
ncbi:hypothetical protein PUN28_017811 [Cardiocondyla obscurior]|uniref:Uncharacterized protein n=1 Tax=Cardiocondyla obscurior TaxID=286306 RepID=A0AAW2EMY9_9HYME